MITIHCAFHAHLDPVWMWPWTAGLDEAIATSRSACDRLDAHPDLFYTQGEAWSFAMVERADPALFARIRRHIEAGRWEVVNGWWTQPDCNLPSLDGLHAQLRTGLAYVKDRFGVAPRCGFNPDSFGHCAILPEVLRAHGQDRYVFMRPQEHEMALPARLFRWRSRGAEVAAFRLGGNYQGGQNGNIDAARRAITGLPEGCRHALALFGIGNHGGGPSERIIRLVRDSRDAIPGARLEFSTVGRFFDAVTADGTALPEFAGELQQHAIGCYTVVRAAKTGIRRAEHALARASAADPSADLEGAWRAVAAHHFHDTLGGSSVPDAYAAVTDQLAGATAAADEILAYALRRQTAALPADPLPRVVLGNPGDRAWSGWCEASTYVEGPWTAPFRLLAADGSEVPYQAVHPNCGVHHAWNWGVRRLLLRTAIPAGGTAVLRCDHTTAPSPVAGGVQVAGDRLVSGAVAVEAGAWGARLTAPGVDLPVRLHLIADPSDTWGHGRSGFDEVPGEIAAWDAPVVIERGPLRAALRQEGRIGASRLSAEWRVLAGAAMAELILDVSWAERHQLLKLVLPLAGETQRIDGTPGLAVARANDGRELPVHDAVALPGWGVVCPDVFAADATPDRLRLTLLRSPLMAQHEPVPPAFPRPIHADRGEHSFRFRFRLAPSPAEALMDEAVCWQRQPLVAECTRGMPLRMIEAVPVRG